MTIKVATNMYILSIPIRLGKSRKHHKVGPNYIIPKALLRSYKDVFNTISLIISNFTLSKLLVNKSLTFLYLVALAGASA
eukprot:snap_masked-scaffold_4-processed-gene-5.53-mRNA-1 protein AED:1.00 eAED:1.00 QI:0/0/0/0/1/1/2/0/79